MTIKEIAQLSGVSISTVSKIMNHKDEHISPKTRDKVLSIAKEYNYSPYAFAMNTSTSKSFLLGVLLRSEEKSGKLLAGILSAAEEAGYHIIICVSKGDEQIELKHVTALCKAKVDGIIWEPVSSNSLCFQKYFLEIGACITWLNAPHSNSHRIDYHALLYKASEYFIKNKHQHFALLTDSSSPFYNEILTGYRAALFEHEFTFNQNSLLPPDASDWMFHIKSGYLTGIICTDYQLAYQLKKSLKQHLYEIPYDLSLITLVDDDAPSIVSTEFSSIIIPFYDFGMHLCKTLIKQCEQHSTLFLPFITDYELKSTITLDIPASKRLPQIIVVGSINTDINLNIPHLPTPNETITTSRHTISPGGKGTNQAVGVAKLNHKVTLLGNVGNDLDVGLIYSCLEEYGIDSSGIHRDKSVNTGKAYIQIQDDGESMITILTGANATLTAQTIRSNNHLFENCAYCLLQTEIAIEAVEEAVLIAKENNVKTILKPAAVSSLSDNILQHTDILIPNQTEIALLCNCSASIDTPELSRQADIMLKKGVGIVIITLGEHGCFLKTNSMERRFPAADFIPMDSTGGSDAFISAFASYLLYGYDLCSAIQIASYAAGFCISRQGVVPALIDQTSLEKYINNVSPNLLK
ncbi:MAG: PfkB family carbohydrate kinase [Ruminococcus sp.]